MADTFELEVATPERLVIREQVTEAQIPAENGMIGVLADHAPLLSLLGTGELTYSTGGSQNSMAISGGWLEIRDNHVRVLADKAEKASEIDRARAEEALRRARERLDAPASVGVDVARALNAMKRAEARLAAAGVPARGR
ncbi:MAG: F0F1 ATP synthase subunit epsilon [Bryobacteraceae bacterium]